MKIDVFAHIIPAKYGEALRKKAKKEIPIWRAVGDKSALLDLEIRFRLMERYPDVLQVLTVNLPPLEKGLVTPDDAIELAQIANDEIAELVARYPNKFIAGVACLPLTDMDAALNETERAITKLHLRGVQIFTNINGEPLSDPKFKPLYEKMDAYNLPIWLHPLGEPISASGNIATNPMTSLGWPFETTVAMGCLVKSGIFKDHPNIKFITHHCGGMIPYFGSRLRREDINDFRRFYNDTALYGNTAALMCGYDFFGADHILFGTDAPLPPISGYTRETIVSVERMNISDIDKEKIFVQNAVNLLGLPN